MVEVRVAEILIIEDEVGIAESLAYLLRQEGFGVRQTARLGDGREAAARSDLIILDLMLPTAPAWNCCVIFGRPPGRRSLS